MSEGRTRLSRSCGIQRLARVAFAFLVMNSSAVAGLFALLLGKKVWRQP